MGETIKKAILERIEPYKNNRSEMLHYLWGANMMINVLYTSKTLSTSDWEVLDGIINEILDTLYK